MLKKRLEKVKREIRKKYNLDLHDYNRSSAKIMWYEGDAFYDFIDYLAEEGSTPSLIASIVRSPSKYRKRFIEYYDSYLQRCGI